MKQDSDTYTTWMSLDKILLKKKCLIENTLTQTHTHCMSLFMCKAKNRKPCPIRKEWFPGLREGTKGNDS